MQNVCLNIYKEPKWYILIDSTCPEIQDVVAATFEAFQKKNICCMEFYTLPEKKDLNDEFLSNIVDGNTRGSNSYPLEKHYILYVCENENDKSKDAGNLELVLRAYNSFKGGPIEKFRAKEHYFESVVELKSKDRQIYQKSLTDKQNNQYYKLQQVGYLKGIITLAVALNFSGEVDKNNISSNIGKFLDNLL